MKKKIISIFILIILGFSTVILSQQKLTSTIREEQHLHLAQLYMTGGKYLEALQLYQRLWAGNIRNMTYYHGVKECLLNLKRFPEAITATTNMLKITNDFSVESDLGEIYYRSGDTEKANKIWDDII